MSTPVLSCAPADLESSLERAAEVLRRGGLVAFPTETVYGLGANALDSQAVQRIFQAKGRPATNPVIVHVPDIQSLHPLVTSWPPEAQQLAEAFWPGPLSLVLPRAGCVPDVVTAGGPTVAVRVPAHPLALQLLRRTRLPIAAPSANRSNHLSPTLPEHVLRDLDGRIDLILDGGPADGGLESTVLDLSRTPPRLLRPGLIDPVRPEAILGPIERSSASSVLTGTPLPSPGMLARHYAPHTPLELVADDLSRVRQLVAAGKQVGWVSHEPSQANFELHEVIRANLPGDPAAYASELYATLHELDDFGLDRIVVRCPPEGEEWLAIRDRLTRAAR